MQRLIFNGFMVVLGKGVGWVVLYYRMFLAKVQETEKPPKSHRKDNRKALNP
jgi:hypothetical protein